VNFTKCGGLLSVMASHGGVCVFHYLGHKMEDPRSQRSMYFPALFISF